jgi:hypothetical protein
MTPVSQQGRGAIPSGAWLAAGLIAGISFLIFVAMVMHTRGSGPAFILLFLLPLALAGYVLVIGYIYGDARRRGMNAVLWALLAFFAPSAIGIILYFILRDPMPIYCSKCGWPVYKNFPHCPNCGVNVAPVCPSCHRATQPPWTHCPWCGAKVA